MAPSTAAGSEQLLRAAAAKGIAIGAIAGTFAAALILIGWPEAPEAPAVDADGPAAVLTTRAILIDIVELPQTKTRPLVTSSNATRAAEASTIIASPMTAETVPFPIAVGLPKPEPDTPSAGAIAEPPLLSGRSIAFVSELRQVSSAAIQQEEPSPRGGALTRAMGTTAGAFRTAGSSVAGALKKVF